MGYGNPLQNEKEGYRTPKECSFKELNIDDQFRLVSDPQILYQKYDDESAIVVNPFLFEPEAPVYKEGE